MYVRVNVMTAQPSKIDDLARYVEQDVAPIVTRLPGNRGLAMGADRGLGRSSVVSFWTDLDALQASEDRAAGLRSEAAALASGTVDTMVLEVVEAHLRQQPSVGCWNRLSTVSIDPLDIDQGIETYRSSAIPALDAIGGFCATTLNVDRERGQVVAVTTWRDREAMQQSADRASVLRQEMADKAHGTITAIDEEEILVAAFAP